MNKQQFAVRSAVALPTSCPAEFRKDILEIRSGKRPQRKPVAVPLAAQSSGRSNRRRTHRSTSNKVHKAKLAIL